MAEPQTNNDDDSDFEGRDDNVLSLTPASYALNQQRLTTVGAINDLDANPEDAVKAAQLAKATGAGPSLVYGNLDGFEQQHKAALTSTILNNNPYIRDYIQTHPLGSKISNDDWGQLDALSKTLKATGAGSIISGLGRLPLAQMAKDFGEGAALERPIGLFGMPEPSLDEVYAHPGYAAILGAGEVAGAIPDLTMMRIPGGLINVGAQTARRIYEGVTGRSGEEGTENFLQAISDPAAMASINPILGEAAEVFGASLRMREEIKKSAPYVKAGELPPPGVSKTIDDARVDETKEFLKTLKEQQQAAGATNTIERDPQSFKDFVNQHQPENIELQADAVRTILGDEPAKPGDGKFGDVSGFNEELALAERHGGHVQVPLADWLVFAKDNPDEAKFLQDYASRPGGITKAEGEVMRERQQALGAEEKPEANPAEEPKEGEAQPVEPVEVNPHAQAIASIRAGAGLDSIFAQEPGIIPENAEVTELEHQDKVYPSKHFLATDAFKMIDKDHLEGIPRALAEFFHDRFDRMAGNTPVITVHPDIISKINKSFNLPDKTPAFYSPDDKAIVMREDVASGQGYAHSVAAHILIHETVHAATYHAMEEFPEIKEAVEALRNETDRHLSHYHPQDREQHAYAFKDAHEFVAETFSNPRFQEVLSLTPLSKDLAKRLGLHEQTPSAWDAVKEIIAVMLERFIGKRPPPTILDGMMRVGEAFEEANKIRKGKGGGEALGAEPIEGRKAFKTPAATGLSADAMRRYLGLIDKQHQIEADHIQSKALEDERKRQTAEWKENEKTVKADVREGVYRRPVIAADRYLREGILDGKKAGSFKLDKAGLTEEQVGSLDPSYVGSAGANPDDMARLFGFQSGDALVSALGQLKAEREMEGLTPAAHISKMVDVATEHEMQRRYGDLEENILREAKEHVFSPTQIDILADETVHLATLAKSELPISKEDLMKGARQIFDAAPIRAISSKAFEASSGRAGLAVQDALLKGDYRAALKAKQEQANAAIYANLALKFEKTLKRFQETDAPRWGRRQPPGVPQEDAVWMHQILLQVMGPDGIQTSRQDLQRRMQMSTPYSNLRDYVEARNKANGTASIDPDNPPITHILNVTPDLFSANWPGKDFDGLSTAEFQAVYDSLKSINHYGHETNKYEVKGNKEDLAEVVSGLIERLKAAVDNKPAVERAHEESPFRNIGSLLLNTETWLNRLDLGNRQGPFNQLILRPITEGQYNLRQMEKDFSAKWKDLGEYPDFNRRVNNTMFRTSDGRFLDMTKGHAYAVLQNMGNAIQRKKLVQGWNISPDLDAGEQMVWHWLKNTAGMGPADLARAQKMGKIFSDAFTLSEHAYVHTAGVAPARIELYKVRTPWGDADEWYHPLIKDPLEGRSNVSADDMMGESGFWKPSPASGYTKTRTGAVYPLDLSFTSAAFKLKQILNDAAMRIPITEVSKIVYNKDFASAFKRYYGPEYHSALDAWMKDTAGNRQWQPQNMRALDRFVNALAQNLSTMMIGFNPSTVMKHGLTAGVFSASEVGFKNWAGSMMKIIKEAPGSKETWNWVMENSEEVRNRLNHIEDTLSNQNRNLFTTEQNRAFDSTRTRISNFRDAVSYYGHYPVGMADLLSAVSMFHAEYKRLEEENPDMTHGDLQYAANTAVRRTHGSSILSNRSAVQRHMSPFVRLLMPFYNFMGNALQRNYELAWQSKLAMQGRELPEMTGFLKEKYEAGPQHIPRIMGGVAVFGLTLSMVAYMVNKVNGNAPKQGQGESDAGYWAKVLASGYADQVPVIRDFFNSAVEGRDPSVGLYGTAAQEIGKPLSFKNWNLRNNPGKTFRTAMDAIAVADGLTTASVDKLGEYIINIAAGKEHPKGFGDLWQGVMHGTQQGVRR